MRCSDNFMRISIAVAFRWMVQDSAHEKQTFLGVMIGAVGHKPLPEPMSPKVHDAIWHLQVTMR